jgi:branched-chain amino acid transport system ATP-binding protein
MSALLTIDRLVKRFGGVTATNDLTLDLRQGELHALIGPNGAGKTTLIAQIMGELRPDSGTISLDGQSLNALSTAARTRRGLARTFQIVQLLPASTALENVAQAVRARRSHGFHFWRDARGDDASRTEAMTHLTQVALDHRSETTVANLAHGEQKQLELAIALATQPRVLLLDEPLAGLGIAENERMIDILRALKGKIAMLLIEHDMDAVYALADRISVLVNGGLIASGSANDIRANADVRTAYLGDEVA